MGDLLADTPGGKGCAQDDRLCQFNETTVFLLVSVSLFRSAPANGVRDALCTSRNKFALRFHVLPHSSLEEVGGALPFSSVGRIGARQHLATEFAAVVLASSKNLAAGNFRSCWTTTVFRP